MGNMAVGILVETCLIDLTQSEIAGCWILQIGEVIDTGTIPVLVLIDIMIVIAIILSGGVIGDTF